MILMNIIVFLVQFLFLYLFYFNVDEMIIQITIQFI